MQYFRDCLLCSNRSIKNKLISLAGHRQKALLKMCVGILLLLRIIMHLSLYDKER